MNAVIPKLPDWVDEYLVALESTGLQHSAAAMARTTVRAVKKLREESTEFDMACSDAEQRSHDVLEAEARRRAVEGIEKGIYYKGTLVDTERQYSDTLLTTLLKAKRPDEFAERKQITGANGGPLTVLVRSFTTTEDGRVVEVVSQSATTNAIDAEFRPIPAPAADPLADIMELV